MIQTIALCTSVLLVVLATANTTETDSAGNTTEPTPDNTTMPTPDNTTMPTPDNTTMPTPDNTTMPTPDNTTMPPPDDTAEKYILTFVGMHSSDSESVSNDLTSYLSSAINLNVSSDRLKVYDKDDFTYVNITVLSTDNVYLIQKSTLPMDTAGSVIVLPSPAIQQKRSMAAQDKDTLKKLESFVHDMDYKELYEKGHMYDVALSTMQYPTDMSKNPSFHMAMKDNLAMGSLVVDFWGDVAPHSPSDGSFDDIPGEEGGSSAGGDDMPSSPGGGPVLGTACSLDVTDDILNELKICDDKHAMLIPYVAGGNGPIYISNLTFTTMPEFIISSPYDRKTHCTHMMDAGVMCGNQLRQSDANDYFTEEHSIECSQFTGSEEDAPMALAKLLNAPMKQISVFKHDEKLYINFNTSSSLTSDDIYLIWQMTNDWAKQSIAKVSRCKKVMKPAFPNESNSSDTNSPSDSNSSSGNDDSNSSSGNDDSNSSSGNDDSNSSSSDSNNSGTESSKGSGDLVTTQVRFSGTGIDKQKLKELLQQKLGAKEGDIVEKDGDDGSVVFEFATAALAMQALSLANSNELQEANVSSAAGEPLPEEDSSSNNTIIIVLAVIGGIILIVIIAFIVYKVCCGGSSKSGFEEDRSENTADALLAPTSIGDTEMAEKPEKDDPPKSDPPPVKPDDI